MFDFSSKTRHEDNMLQIFTLTIKMLEFKKKGGGVRSWRPQGLPTYWFHMWQGM